MKHIFSLIFILTLLAVPFAPGSFQSQAAPAATIVVDTEVDELDGSPGNGSCSLREAITNANNDNGNQADCTAGSGADTITLPAGFYTLTGAADEDDNATGDLDISGTLTINGAGAETTVIRAGTNATDSVDRVLHIHSGATVEINRVEVMYGKAPDGTTGGDGAHGGGILNESASLTLNDCSVRKNRAGNGEDGNPGGWGGRGGGIFNDAAVLILNDTIVRQNVSGAGGDGGVGSDGGFGGVGGGIYLNASSVVTLTGSTVSDNITGNGGDGGDAADGDAGDGKSSGYGAGIFNGLGTLTLVESAINGNLTGSGGNGGNVTGGNGNGGDSGGSGISAGIYQTNPEASLMAVESTFKENETGPAGTPGAGAGTGSDGAAYPRGVAGGLSLINNAHAILINSTFSANTAYEGGGIYLYNGAQITLTNSTISANQADQNGGGIYIGFETIASLTNSTITGNTADQDDDGDGGGGGFSTYGTFCTFTMTNTIVAENTDKGNEHPDCWGTFVSGDNNLLGIGDNTGCNFTPQANDLVGTLASPLDPVLGLLADNGGNTATHALLPGSPAIDAIPLAACPLDEDQRGFPRPVDYDGDHTAQCDIGSVEMQESYTLAIVLAGDGTGNISSNPAGIDCGDGGTDCSTVFYQDMVITLTATAVTGSSFSGWGGDASGTDNPLMITIDGDKSIEANFVENVAE